MASDKDQSVTFLQYVLPELGYKWEGFRKPRGQVLKRIRERMQELGLSGGHSEYRAYLEAHPNEWDVLDRLCDVTISKFLRDRRLWNDLLYRLIRDRAPGPMKVWSAGCCNGEEAYSVAIITEQLTEELSRGMKISILATDRNPEVLERAKMGQYPAGALKELTDEETERFFRPTENGSNDDYRINERLGQYIEFEQRDIRRSMPDRVFDLVFCRNLVFTYFNTREQLRFLERLEPHINKDGYLVIGSNENLSEDVEWLVAINNTYPIYKASVRK